MQDDLATNKEVGSSPRQPLIPRKSLRYVSLAGFLAGAIVLGFEYLLTLLQLGLFEYVGASPLLDFPLYVLFLVLWYLRPILLFLISGVISYIILKFFRVQSAAGIALYGVGGIIAGLLLVGGLQLPTVAYWLLLPVIGGVTFTLVGWLYRGGLSKRAHLFLIPLLLGVIVGAFTLGTYLPDMQYEKEQIKRLDFDLYAPSFIPPEYRVSQSWLLGGVGMGGEDEPPYHEITYLYRENDIGDRDVITLLQFKVTDKYRPPMDCGPTMPESSYDYTSDIDRPCENIGLTTEGDPVYFYDAELHGTLGQSDYYLRRGETLIVLEISSVGGEPLTKDEILQILNSIEKRSIEELEVLVQ